MQKMKWLAVLCFVIVLVSCFLPWITIEGKDLRITGIDATAIGFGKPAYFHFLLCIPVLILLLVNRIWSISTAFFIAAFNIAWAARNYIALASCSDVCPERQPALYALLVFSVLGVFAILLAGNERNRLQHPVA